MDGISSSDAVPILERHTVSDKEKIVLRVLEMWGVDEQSTLDSWSENAVPELVLWNSARGGIDGLEACLQGISMMWEFLEVARVDVPIKSIAAIGDTVYVERTDDLYRADGSLVAAMPVVGVVKFEGDKIIEWRDYCEDWMLKLNLLQQLQTLQFKWETRATPVD